MSRTITRLLAVTALAAGFGILPMPGVRADSAVVVADMPTGFSQNASATGECHSTSDPNQMPKIDVNPGDQVQWYMHQDNQAKHNITPANDVPGGQHWDGVTKSDDLAAGEGPFTAKFSKSGLYFYYSSANGEGTDKKGVLDGMCGVIHVVGAPAPTTTTSTTPTPAPTQPAPTTDTTRPTPGPTATTAPATASPSANHPSAPAAPAPTTTTAAKAEKDKKPKDDTTTTTAPPVNGPVDLPAEAIVPNINPNGTATQDGVVQPSSTPTGDATALIAEKHGKKGVKLLIVTGLGIGALGVGTGIYKYANRSSKYFPA